MVIKDKVFLFLILAVIGFGFFTLLNSPEREIAKRLFNRVNFFQGKQPIYSKGIYLTSWTAGSKRADELLELAKRTELNSVVIDIKNYTGRIAFDTDSELINSIGSEKVYIKDIKKLINKFHKAGIYTIARIVVFEDDYLARERPDLSLKRKGGGLWYDYRGLTWLDPNCKEVWDYNIELAKQAAEVGFDEINLDYIRFPSDGNISNIVFPFWDGIIPKTEVLRQFFEYFSQQVKPLGVFISADLFGLTLTAKDDMNIGQWLEFTAPYFDYICPMVYPSHYASGFEGFENPADYPYEVIYKGLTTGAERIASISANAKIRPWLQDFDLGAVYTAEMVKLEKQAVYDANAYGWLLWNSSNIYTEEALVPSLSRD